MICISTQPVLRNQGSNNQRPRLDWHKTRTFGYNGSTEAMNVVCSRCGTRNRVPDMPEKGKIYRCWQCKTILEPGTKEVNPNWVSATNISVRHDTRTIHNLAFIIGILLLCCSTILLLLQMGSMAGNRVVRNSKGGLDIVMYPNEILSEVAKPIANITDEDRQLALLLENTMLRMDGQGLSAPQVGVSKRMVVVKLTRPASDKEAVVMINPEIIEQAGSSKEFEGCLSLPRGDREIEVTRSEEISVRYLTLEGNEVVLEESGANARVIQHEIDHLNGIQIVDYHKAFRMTLPILLAIVVYSIAACVAAFIFIFNRRKRKVAD